MWRRLALTIGTLSLLTACASERPRPLDESEVRAFLGRYAEAWANYDFDYLRTATDSAWIGVQLSFPVTRDSAFALFRPLQEAGVTQRYVPSDARVRIMGDVAWVAWTLNGTYTAPATDAGRAALRALGSSEGGAREKFVETMVVYRSPAGLKVALHHVTPMSSEPLADAQAVK